MKSKVLRVSHARKNNKKRILLTLAVAALAVGTLVLGVLADAPPGPYFNGFETDTAGWFNYSGATITRVPSGSVSTYANGVPAATGNYYARLRIDPSPDSCTFGGGTAPIYYGPFTRWGGYSGIFPPGGYSTGVDIYLDVPYAVTHPDTRFDWSSAISDTAGGFRRDFVFNVGTDPLGFVITGGNNATRCGANPADPGHSPVVHIMRSGWYTFKHTFTGVTGSPLVVFLQVIEKSTNAVLGTWMRSDPSDIIGTTVGGNRYGWFVQNEFDDLAIDNSFRTGAMSTPGCSVTITNGGWFTADNGDRATFGGNARVSSEGDAQGQQEYQDHGPTQPMTVNSISVVAIQCSEDRTMASIFGTASVDGSGMIEYVIDVTDAGEPGRGDTYQIRIPGVYNSGPHNLQGGNIQIR
ncbi:MAG TPA: post-COAP-1 domain-containing protein [Pyrinomonadaceae bacterium]|nr:post-COAP-1 domain-containing protein [Pyrinomonadaceae bacterium]